MNIKAFINNRLSRKHYFLGTMLFGFITYILVGIPFLFLTSSRIFSQGISLLVFFPFLMVLANRRSHDMGASGKYYFIFAILNLVYNLIFIHLLSTSISTVLSAIFGIMSLGIGMALLFTSGEDIENEYGKPTHELPFFEALFPKDHIAFKVAKINENKEVNNNNEAYIQDNLQMKKEPFIKPIMTTVAIIGIIFIAGSSFYYLVLRPMHKDNELGRCLEKVQNGHYKQGEKAMQFYRENCFKQYK